MSKHTTKISKLLSLVLRHKPETIGVSLDKNGWLAVDDLLTSLEASGNPISLALLKEVVDTNEKQRFIFSDDGLKIRANQGHSITSVDMAFTATVPPDVLYHGTVAKYLESIEENGLQKMSRQHVHLSETTDTANIVGKRRGNPVILKVNAGEMHRAGFEFYLSANGVWLTDYVPAKFIMAAHE